MHSALLRGNFISGSGSSVLIKREVFDRVGLFNEFLPACEDWEMWLRITKQFTIDYVDLPLVLIRQHSKSMQKDTLRMLTAELLVLNLFYLNQERNSFLLWKIRTILHQQKIPAQDIPNFDQCCAKLQSSLSGWGHQIACFTLIPMGWVSFLYLKLKHKKNNVDHCI